MSCSFFGVFHDLKSFPSPPIDRLTFWSPTVVLPGYIRYYVSINSPSFPLNFVFVFVYIYIYIIKKEVFDFVVVFFPDPYNNSVIPACVFCFFISSTAKNREYCLTQSLHKNTESVINILHFKLKLIYRYILTFLLVDT